MSKTNDHLRPKLDKLNKTNCHCVNQLFLCVRKCNCFAPPTCKDDGEIISKAWLILTRRC